MRLSRFLSGKVSGLGVQRLLFSDSMLRSIAQGAREVPNARSPDFIPDITLFARSYRQHLADGHVPPYGLVLTTPGYQASYALGRAGDTVTIERGEDRDVLPPGVAELVLNEALPDGSVLVGVQTPLASATPELWSLQFRRYVV